MTVNWGVWALRIITIAIGVTLGYLIGVAGHSGIITDYFAYCEKAMP